MLPSLTARPLRLSLAALSLLAACVGVAAQDAGVPEPSSAPPAPSGAARPSEPERPLDPSTDDDTLANRVRARRDAGLAVPLNDTRQFVTLPIQKEATNGKHPPVPP